VTSLDELYAKVCNEVSDVFLHCPTIREFASRCEHVTELGLNSLGVCVSIMAGQPGKFVAYGKKKEQLDAVIEQLPKKMGKTHVRFMHEDPLKTQIEETDMLVIDTYHSYSQLNAELRKHGGNVKRYIVIVNSYAFGTVGQDGSSPGVMDAVSEFVDKNDKWEVVYNERKNNGLLIIEREPRTGPDFDRIYSMVTYDIPDVKWIERFVIGMVDPRKDWTGRETEAMAKKETQRLNSALRYGVLLGVERNFTIVKLEDKEIISGYLVYHVGFRHRPIGK